MALKYWYVFVVVLALSVTLAYYNLKFTPPEYSASALVLIKDEEKSGQLDQEAIFKELGLSQKNKSLENEQLVLRSSSLMEDVVDNLQLQHGYYTIGKFGWRLLYKDSPIQVVNWEPNTEHNWLVASLTFDDSGGFQLLVENEKHDEEVSYEVTEFKGEFGRTLTLPMGKVTLARKIDFPLDNSVGLTIYPVKAVAKGFSNSLGAEIMGVESSVINLSITDQSGQRAADILTELFSVYNSQSIEDRKSIFENTIDLINDRIEMISQQLEQTEQNVEAYKSQYRIGELTAEGSLLLTELQESSREISDTDVQLQIMDKIETFLRVNQSNFTFVPTNLSVNNLTLTRQLETFNELLGTRERQRNRLGPSHKDLRLTESQISNLRQTIIDNIRSIRTDLQISRNASAERKGGIEGRLSSLPRRERELIEIEREKSIQENLYLYLLQKREESFISLAITSPNAKLIEPSAPDPDPISPKPLQAWIVAGFLGLAIPAGLVFVLTLLNDKIRDEDDIQQLTAVPINGAISLSRKKDSIVVQEDRKTAIAEMFRLLRANLAYIAPGEELKALLVTSSTSGEGKSFISLNLGISQALAGKKVIIIDLDLRKPTQEKLIADKLSIGNDNDHLGVVNYLVDHTILEKQVIRNSGLNSNLDVILAGPTPPNPSELILSSRLKELIEKLRETYDFIIVDSPPVGLVADALQMKDFVDSTMYVTRSGYTKRSQIKIINDIAEKGKLPRPFIVINAMPISKGSYYGGYGSSNVYGANKKGRGYYQKES